MTDIEIAQAVEMQHINDIAAKLNVDSNNIEQYGKYKAKLPLDLIDKDKVAKSKLILVTAITPTPAGEGKTTVSIGLHEGLNKIGKKECCGFKRTVSRSGFWYKRWSCRRWLLSSCANGGYQPAFYW